MVGRKLPLLVSRFQDVFDGEIGRRYQRERVRHRDGCRGWMYVGDMGLVNAAVREKV